MGKSVLNFSDIIGQKPIVKWCQAMLESRRLPKVSLFVGPSGVGKTSTAKVLACEYVANGDKELINEYKKHVISGSVDSYEGIHIYNMSNLDSTAVMAVREDLNISFSRTGLKVIIMDEAHGMKDDAQDTLLTAFEALPEGVHIIICTTNRSKLKPALVSRCVPRYFSRLSTQEMRLLIDLRLKEKNIDIRANESIVANYLISYAGHEARALNGILDQIPDNSILSMDDLEMYIPIYEPKAILTLIKYLYNGNIIAGLNLIPDLSTDEVFKDVLIDILRAALGDDTRHFTRSDMRFIQEITSAEIGRLVGFVIDVTNKELTHSRLSSLFIYWNAMCPERAISADASMIQREDVKNMEVPEVNINVSRSSSEVIYEDLGDFLRNKMVVTGNEE